MNRIDKLIKELCPDGVEYKKLSEITNLTAGDRITKSMMNENMEYPVYGGGVIPTGMYKDYNFEHSITISRAGSAGFVNWVEDKFWATDVCFVASERNINYNIKYIYYFVKNKQTELQKRIYGGNLPKLNKDYIWNLKIAVPPLEIQNEIVYILDSFLKLLAELSNELKVRKKQYNYYLNYLLDINRLNPSKQMLVKDLFEIKNGLNKEKSAFGKGTPIVNFTDVFNNRYLTTSMLKGKVTLTSDEIKRYEVKKGDVFFTRTSETKEEIGMSSTVVEDIPNCTFSGFVLRARPITDLLLPKFCSYYFSTNQVRDNIIRYASFTTRATTSGPKLSKIPVPIISKEKQEKIVKFLDIFDKLCNDTCEGLPAEIEARQKQYEYYRDKLLTFKELVNEG